MGRDTRQFNELATTKANGSSRCQQGLIHHQSIVLHKQLFRTGAIDVLLNLEDLIMPGIATPDLLLDLVMTFLQDIS